LYKTLCNHTKSWNRLLTLAFYFANMNITIINNPRIKKHLLVTRQDTTQTCLVVGPFPCAHPSQASCKRVCGSTVLNCCCCYYCLKRYCSQNVYRLKYQYRHGYRLLYTKIKRVKRMFMAILHLLHAYLLAIGKGVCGIGQWIQQCN
jgi:hypothetical protein